MSENIFQITPSGSASLWVLVPTLLMLIGLALLIFSIFYSAKNSTVHITEEQLVIKGGLYGRKIPYSEINIEDAQIINLYRKREFQFRSRRNGVGLPGYQSGWFRLVNGEKALAFVTDQKEVLYIPTKNGYSLMLSLENTGRFLKSLEAKV